MNTNFHHIPVMLNEVIENLQIKDGEKYIDATLGGGGHTKEILKHGGKVLGIDQDQDALDFVKEDQKESISNNNLTIAKGNFRDLTDIARKNNFTDISGILMDLGVSSYQLDTVGRGFSIKHEDILDMRMDKSSELSAIDVVNTYSYERLVDIFYRYGEEHNAKGIAQMIVDTRKKKPITTTQELSKLVEKIPHKSEDIHPTTRVFQAIRIEVNDELSSLKAALEEAIEVLRPGGRLVVITFHSLEDRIVKMKFEKMMRGKLGFLVNKKPLVASFDETQKNKRSRSAKLRVFEKI